MDIILCTECADRETCTELCKEVEEYISQDEVEWRESPITIYTQGEELRVFDVDTGEDKPLLTLKEKDVLDALAMCMTRTEVAEKLKISMSTLRTHIENIRLKVSTLSP